MSEAANQDAEAIGASAADAMNAAGESDRDSVTPGSADQAVEAAEVSEPDTRRLDAEQPDANEPGEMAPDEAPVADEDAIAVLASERDSYLEQLQRITADFANFRRQSSKRISDTVAREVSQLVTRLLAVLDGCEAAVAQGVEGIEAVHTQLLGELTAQGLSVVGEVGEAFDPNSHEAVMTEPRSDDDDAEATGTEPVVTEVLRTGYTWRGQLLRAAMVKVKN